MRMFAPRATSRNFPSRAASHINPSANKIDHNNRKRKRYEFEENHTAALKLDISNEELERLHVNEDALFAAAKDNIIKHASRRVDLFFYTLIAYYKTKRVPHIGHTVLQHGRGRNTHTGDNITQGCHSSFFTALVDYPSNDPHEKINQNGLLTDTFLLDSLNAVVESPDFVNELDNELEVPCHGREEGLKIIRKVAFDMNPVAGLTAFLKMLDKMFNDLNRGRKFVYRATPYLSRLTHESSTTLKAKLLSETRYGTFLNKWDDKTQTVREDYIQLLLRLNSQERAECALSEVHKVAVYEKKILVLQQEILQSPRKSDLTGYLSFKK